MQFLKNPHTLLDTCMSCSRPTATKYRQLHWHFQGLMARLSTSLSCDFYDLIDHHRQHLAMSMMSMTKPSTQFIVDDHHRHRILCRRRLTIDITWRRRLTIEVASSTRDERRQTICTYMHDHPYKDLALIIRSKTCNIRNVHWGVIAA